ncbi:MAG: stage V sporulation protein AC [Ruminococcus sp.]|nr:stage V sporulation protein AC [Ruminococcus sp.]
MNITQQQYSEMVKLASPGSKPARDIPCAFVIGGLICILGQALTDMYARMGFDERTSAAWCTVTLVFLSALFTGLGLYSKLAKYGGAGTLVPVTGFANAVASPAVEFKSEGLVLGLGAKIFIIAGPVILYGAAASVVYGIIYFFMK